MFRFLQLSLKYHWGAHRSNPVNFYSAVIGMIVNNLLFIYGMWLLLFSGKPQNTCASFYFFAIQGLIAVAWGVINFGMGGLREMAYNIDMGAIEPALGTPRRPLFILALSESHPTAIGDLIEGFFILLMLFKFAPLDFTLRVWSVLPVVTASFTAVFILAGSVAFFLQRGANLGSFLIESTLTLGSYPTGKILTGSSRYIVMLTPAWLVSVLPMDAVESIGGLSIGLAYLSSFVFLVFSVWIFSQGLRRYRAGSYIGSMR